jgi:mannose-6-phosphate isomerase-like protein (cupin superfamily)
MMAGNTNFAPTEENHPNGHRISSRKIVAKGADLYVKELTLGVGEEVPLHTHSKVFDIFYCLEGTFTIELHDPRTKERLPDLKLKVGDSAKVDVGIAHRPYNTGSSPCRFLTVQGFGEYDYIRYSAN